MDKSNPSPWRRNSLRWSGYDYRLPGQYYVTICTFDREPLLAKINKSNLEATPIGEMVERIWQKISVRFPGTISLAFSLMPDHVHGILEFRPSNNATLSDVIRWFKAVSGRNANRMLASKNCPLWQRSFYDRVIRDSEELARFRKYIRENPEALIKEFIGDRWPIS